MLRLAQTHTSISQVIIQAGILPNLTFNSCRLRLCFRLQDQEQQLVSLLHWLQRHDAHAFASLE